MQDRKQLFIADNNDSLRTAGKDFIPSPDGAPEGQCSSTVTEGPGPQHRPFQPAGRPDDVRDHRGTSSAAVPDGWP